MPKIVRKLIRPSNRGVRLMVGLLLAALLCIQVARSIATPEVQRPGVVDIDGGKIVVTDRVAFKKAEELARSDHVALLKRGLENLESLGAESYTCTFVKQERIRGELGAAQTIAVKFRRKPFSVAMTWTENAPTADTILYVEGRYRDDEGRSQMLVRPKSGILRALVGGSVLRLPDGPDAMKKTLRPCTQFGFRNSIQSLIDVYELARERGESTERFEGFAEIGGRPCFKLVRRLPKTHPDYPAQKTIVLVDTEWMIPLRIIGDNWQGERSCDYQFTNVDFGVALRDADFTPAANNIEVSE
ncbi:MAG: DUF1571 domain-containing protein [Planctomycetes bacterium]|nr:DUF1571 domain-containing protein [Phycisphaerae bacterium]NBB95835.1 DUF1571 domain-containing protein [Planctomycetota bacterium]